jgi:uncharacterized protein YecE (DUF72 family)
MTGEILVGTSSWADPGFVEEWYPPGLAAEQRLPWYAERFRAVEVNSTFYALPRAETTARWARATPPGFVFDIKLHRLLSRHAAPLDSLPQQLRDGVRTSETGRVVLTPGLEDAMLEATLEATQPLREAGKLGAFLLQLSPSFAPRTHALDELAAVLDRLRDVGIAVELRRRSWLADERREDVLGFLEQHGAAFVGVDAPSGEQVTILPSLDAVTAPRLAYLRLHGRNQRGYVHGRTVAERFAYRYSDEELIELRERALALAEDAAEVHVMLNTNRGSDAPVAARRLRELLGQDPGPEPARTPLARAG